MGKSPWDATLVQVCREVPSCSTILFSSISITQAHFAYCCAVTEPAQAPDVLAEKPQSVVLPLSIPQLPVTSQLITSATTPPPPQPFTFRHPVLYPNHYAWFVLLSSLDIMLTHTILNKFGKEFNPRELNTFADWVIKNAGLWGAIGLKTFSIVTVVVIIEVIGRRRPSWGKTMANCVVAMAIVPVFVALVQLAAVAFLPHNGP